MPTTIPSSASSKKAPCNKGQLIGQKRPLKPKDVWAIRIRLQLEGRKRDLALFNLAIDSKLRGCDLVRLQVDDVCAGTRVRDRGTVIQKKTGRPVQFEITEQTRSRSETGCRTATSGIGATCSRAACGRSRTSPPGNTRGSSMPGSRLPGSTARPTARIRCAGRRRRRSARRRETCVPFSSCSDIRSSKAPSAISASRSTACSAFRSRSSSEYHIAALSFSARPRPPRPTDGRKVPNRPFGPAAATPAHAP
jgi:hypothetical protein